MKRTLMLKSFASAALLLSTLSTPAFANTQSQNTTIKVNDVASFISGFQALTPNQPKSALVGMESTWANDFSSNNSVLSAAHLILNINFPGVQNTQSDSPASIQGEIKIGSKAYQITSTVASVVMHNTSVGAMDIVDATGTIETNNGPQQTDMLILYSPETGKCSVSLTIHDSQNPIFVSFGSNNFSQSVRNEIFPQQTANSALRGTSSTNASAVQPDTSSIWNEVAHDSTNVVGGTTISGPACVVLASDQVQGSSNVLRDQVWGGTAAQSYLASTWGVSTSDVGVNVVHYAVNESQQAFQLTDQVYPSPSAPNPLNAWTWTLNYVPWVGGDLNAIANSYLSYSAIGQDTNGSLYFEQWHLNNPNQTYLTSTANVGQSQTSYSEQFGTTSIGGEPVQVDGLIEYYIEAPSQTFVMDTNWVYASGTM